MTFLVLLSHKRKYNRPSPTKFSRKKADILFSVWSQCVENLYRCRDTSETFTTKMDQQRFRGNLIHLKYLSFPSSIFFMLPHKVFRWLTKYASVHRLGFSYQCVLDEMYLRRCAQKFLACEISNNYNCLIRLAILAQLSFTKRRGRNFVWFVVSLLPPHIYGKNPS